ncbi:MAG: hypothetical protein K0R26_1896 [Bacteroidota bacterium]|jgi:hypothetical protein|nr:hypothetical protein [Bacteroidota bacterium]
MKSGKNKESGEWMSCTTQVFWGEIAPYDHLVQIYESKAAFLDLLEGYVLDGFRAGDCVVIIATTEHLKALNKRLKKNGCNLGTLISDHQYIPLDAAETLSTFMKNGWPDETLFMATVNSIISKAKARSRQVRAFGEMVALLWEQGHNGATVQLEHLWSRFCQTESLCLFCAYPKAGFTQNPDDSLQNICCSHSKIIAGTRKSAFEVFYKIVDPKRKPD